jgi:hypothetical protein
LHPVDSGTQGCTPGASYGCQPFSEWSDFDDCHGKNCVCLQLSVSVRLNMIQPDNDQQLKIFDKLTDRAMMLHAPVQTRTPEPFELKFGKFRRAKQNERFSLPSA